jgi:predicted pyridoxine 5'-phosphate oxidase superfamily flavin-nucleotide-binding protein
MADSSSSPFHAGEQALQSAWGLRERMEQVGRVAIRPFMPEQHRELFGKLPTLWLGTLDEAGQPWATLLAGAPGFVDSPDPQTLRVAALPAATDPAAIGLKPGVAIGLLGLEPQTRRRNRMNGRVLAIGADGFEAGVLQSFGNCPKYIQAREPIVQAGRVPGPVSIEGSTLSAAARALIEAGDTLFIASSSGPAVERAGRGGAGVDISHRGGPPGFAQLQSLPDGDRLSLPVYLGNSMFITLGNLLAWPRAGLLFVDWKTGDMLQLAASAEIRAVSDADAATTPVQRHWLDLRIEHGCWRPAALPLSWTAPQAAPQFAAAGA